MVTSPPAKPRTKGGRYGRIVGRIYDYFFSDEFTGKRRQIRQALEVFARGARGSLLDDGYTELFPKVGFEGRGYGARLVVTPAFQARESFDLTAVFTSRMPGIDRFPFPVIELFSSSLLPRIFTDPCMRAQPTGDRTFDYWFMARSLSAFPLDDFLGREGKRVIFALHYLYGRHNVHVSCQGSRLLVRKAMDAALLSDAAAVRPFWRYARVLFRRLDRNLRLRFGVGRQDWIRVVEVGEGKVPRCTVCGEPVFFNRVHCARCDTPYHLDCWEYAGCCSMYGCGCRDFHYQRFKGGPAT